MTWASCFIIALPAIVFVIVVGDLLIIRVKWIPLWILACITGILSALLADVRLVLVTWALALLGVAIDLVMDFRNYRRLQESTMQHVFNGYIRELFSRAGVGIHWSLARLRRVEEQLFRRFGGVLAVLGAVLLPLKVWWSGKGITGVEGLLEPQPTLILTHKNLLDSQQTSLVPQDEQSLPSDVFQNRVSVEEVETIVLDLAYLPIIQHLLHSRGEVEFREFVDFLRRLYAEIRETLSDPEKLAPILAEVLVVAPAATLGFGLGRHMLQKIREWARNRDNLYCNYIVERFECLLNHFKEVPKSRITEIEQGTGLTKQEIQALLRLGPFTHEPGCFWRFADRLDTKNT